uniref:Non-specific serine/threonine protein kinase n=1 Tax=Panagrolaimus sp. PS1159 TaxID=55785 RepID=A0AC35F4B2_9BILA
MSAEDSDLIFQCIEYGNEELLRELIDANPSSSSFSSPDGSGPGISPLHLAATKGFCGCMKILLSTKCDVDVLSSPQTALKTPLLMASESGHDKAVEILLDAGADIFYTDVNGHSALQLAQMSGHSNTVKVLVSNLDKIHTTSGIMRDELIQAIVDGDVGTVYRILAEMPKQCRQRITNGNTTDEKSALYLACEHGRFDIVDALLTLPGHIIIYSVSGDNVLHAAVASQNFQTFEIILKKFPFLMDAPNNDGNLALHWACQNGNFDIVKLMLEMDYPEDEMKYFEDNRGIQTYKFICDLNATDFECRTAFYLAVFKLELFHNDKEPCIGNPLAFNIYCSNGRTALMMACANGSEEIVRILLDHEVDVNLPIALTEKEIREFHPNEEMRCAASGALVEAAKSGYIRIIKLLLRKGAIDYDNRALTAAVKTGKIDEISVFLNQLAFTDNEYRINKKAAIDSSFPGGGTSVLNSSSLLANIFPSTSVQLNWHGAALETLTAEWLTSAALKFNARLRHSRLALTAITRLDLSFNRLTEIPTVIYQLQSLYILDLSQNLIQIIENPPNNSCLPCLENFNLEANYIQTLPSLLFSKTCPNLKVLNAAGNRLRIVPNFIWTAPKLKEINLSSNEIIEISTVFMQQHPQQQRRSAKATHQERIESRASRIRGKHSSTSASVSKVKESPRIENIKEHDIIRLNAWQKKIQLSNIDDLDLDEPAETSGDIFSNSLRTLNLSSNKLKVMPTCLACCCPKLTRLDLSMNEITSLGPLECLPSSLRHLNLCHNRLIKVFTRADSADLLCQAPTIQTPDSRQRPSMGGNRHSRSRSRSVARNQRSLSVVRTSDGERIALSEVCPHKSHCRFEALKTLNLSYNEILQFDLFVPFGFTNDFNSIDQFNVNLKQNSQQMRSYLIFPSLTNLDLSYNALKSIPPTISLLSSLAALNVSGNREMDSLPYELGLLDKLWNIALKDCPVKEPLKSIVNAENYKTVELIAFLRNKLENSKPYNKLKLLILGGPGVGKTQLLQQIRGEGNVIKKNLQSESWSRRLGHNFTTSAIKSLSSKSVQISSGVDVAEWSFEPKKGSKNSPESLGPITFRTWDFDGKMKEYATVCQYFFSRRAIYIVLWKATDGDIALNEIHEWLLFIQSRAPNSTVIIVGTHFDAVEENLQRFPQDYLETLYRTIQERFVNIPDSDKKGLPRVIASLFVSLKSKHNIRSLCNLLYQTAAELKTSGRKQKLLTQKIPSIYLALEVITVTLTDELRAKSSEPIMKFNDFWIYASGRIGEEFGRPFRDQMEFRQACIFLHENGVIVYFDDSALGEFCFLDPPWLYSALASIISSKSSNGSSSTSSNAHENAITTNTDVNAIVKQFINHSTNDSSRRSLLKQCIFRLLYRFEAALPCQNKLLIISSALPDEYLLRADYPGAKIKFKTKLSSFSLQWKPPTMTVSMSPTKKSFFHRKIVRTLAHKHSAEKEATTTSSSPVPKLKFQHEQLIDKKIFISQHPKKNLRRLFAMQYVPPGFWPRLITRILDDEKVTSSISKLFVVHSSEGTPLNSSRRRSSSPHTTTDPSTDPSTAYLSDLINKDGFEWLLWKSGLEINAFGTFILSVKHFLPLASVRDVNYSMTELQKKCEDGQWRPYKMDQTFLVELLIPNFNVRIQCSDGREFILEQDETVAARLLAVFVNIIDDLLEDWFPALGTRFVHTSEGRLLVDRLIPCPDCAYHERNALKSQKSMDLNIPDIHTGGGFPPKSQTMDNFVMISKSMIYLFTVEECILQARGFSPATKDTNFGAIICPTHEQISVELVAPEVSFKDLPNDLVLNDDGIKRGKLMGRGAFGFVFSGFVRKKANEAFNEVALKVLEPVEPGTSAKGSAQAAFEAFMLKWRNDALENCARSYCTARQELNMLTDLNHLHIPTLIGFCARPMTIAVELAPLGALDQILAKYRRVDARLTVDTLQQVCIQISKAIEYLHTNKIIFRDLKSENVLVWRFPLPRAFGDVRVKLGDYGISRFSYPSGVCKGYGGTEGFMAPEIMRANGEQEYNEKVDCFSFGMFVYELISLKQPYDGQEQMKDFILDGGRPFLSDKELLIPSNVLDLMVTCWSEDPDLRPTAAQLVSLTTAPEFGHLLDVSLLDEHTKAKMGTLVSLPPESLSTTASSNSGGNNSNCWLQKDDSEWIILSCSPYGWLECRTLALSQRRKITAICAIDENTIWLADSTGMIRVMSNSTLEELNHFSITDLEPSFASTDISIQGILVFAERQTALITLIHSILICICAGAEKPIFLSSIELAEKIYVTSFLPAIGNWQILTGHENAKMIVHHINGTKTQLIYSASVTHSSPTKLRTTDFKDGTPETAAVKFIVTSRTNTNFVWSSLDGGSSIYFWDNCCLRRTLDCRKILPSSESLSSMSIDSVRDAAISSLCVLSSDHLLIGTTAGLLIVLDGKELTPLAAFRSFSSSIDLILPVLCQSFSVPLNQREPSLQSLNSISSSPQENNIKMLLLEGGGGGGDTASINSTESGVVNDYLLDAVSKVKSMFVSGGKFEKSPSILSEDSYFVAIGHGYRPLIDRFSSAEAISDSESSQKCAVVFRAGDWI